MTSRLQQPVNKNPRALREKKSDQRGVTLLLAILVLSAVTAVVFTVAALALNETRTSGDLIKSEPAITAAEAGTEDVLYYAVRGLGGYSTNCTTPTTTTVNAVTLSYCLNPYLVDPYQFTVNANTQKNFFLYNATSQGAAPGYTNVSVTLNSGISGTVYICSWTNQNCSGSPDVATLTPTTGQTQNSALNPNQSIGYQIIFSNTNITNDVFTVTTTPNGMPSGTATIEVTGSNNGVTRKIQTILPQ